MSGCGEIMRWKNGEATVRREVKVEWRGRGVVDVLLKKKQVVTNGNDC